MKVATLFLALATAVIRAETARQAQCNQMLMESFDVLGQTLLTPDRNYICPGIQDNCCSLQTQLDIYKKWIISGEKKRVKNFYAEFPKIFERIYSGFEQIEEMAAKVYESTLGVPGSNCNRMASVIIQNRPAGMRPKVTNAARVATNFLFKARQGMYCSLCDADNHVYYNNVDYSVTMSSKFCARFVENALPYFVFKYLYFPKISRLMGQFVQQCTLRGEYKPTRFLRHDIKFFRHREFEGFLRTCKFGLSRPGAIAACSGFCGRFNPVKYDSSLEGELDKLVNFAGFLERRLRIAKLEERRTAEMDKEADKMPDARRRILQVDEETKEKRKEHLDEKTDELVAFNREFQTALLRPIPYRFRTDLSIKYNVQFDEPIIRTGYERLYDLLEFRSKFQDDGVDLNSYGQMVNIDREVAMKIFEIINPEKQTGFSFEDFLKTK